MNSGVATLVLYVFFSLSLNPGVFSNLISIYFYISLVCVLPGVYVSIFHQV